MDIPPWVGAMGGDALQLESKGRYGSGRLKSREWTTWHGQKSRGGQRGSGQRGTK